MAYGLHWEWRGFGELSKEIHTLVSGLEPLRSATAIKLVDQYFWAPGCNINVKLRAFQGRETLKLKRLLEVHDHESMQLWLERPEEDYSFPLQKKAVDDLSNAIGVNFETKTVMSGSELLSLVRASGDRVRIVTVEKTRNSCVWSEAGATVLVDFGEISSPECMMTIGLEDLSGLNEHSLPGDVFAARNSVIAARSALGLPGKLRVSSYLEALARWVET